MTIVRYVLVPLTLRRLLLLLLLQLLLQLLLLLLSDGLLCLCTNSYHGAQAENLAPFTRIYSPC